jgi:TrpR-related protein YerC/YecD
MTIMNDENWSGEDHRALFAAVASLADPEEARDFLRDLCTRRELEDMAQRWAVARLLASGLPYREIADITGASTATVTRINTWLQHGTGGYRRVMERIGEPS